MNTYQRKRLALLFTVLFLFIVGLLLIKKNVTQFEDIFQITKTKNICKDCNVIIVTLDTLSANHLPCYGYNRNTSPNLCSFAEKNIFFENAYSNASWTLPSHVSLFTGLLPFRAGVNDYFQELSVNKILLPELLKSNGYNTMLFIPKDNPSLPVKQVYGRLGESIYYNDYYSWEESIDMFKSSVKNGKKTFMFLHTYDVHEPFIIGENEQQYLPLNTKLPKNWDDFNKVEWTPSFANYIISEIKKGIDSNWAFEYSESDAQKLFPELLKAVPDYTKEVVVLDKIAATGMLWNYLFDYQYNYRIDTSDFNDLQSVMALYDQTINILDTNKIPLLTELIENPEFRDNTILVILSDHGEEFMEHGHLWHETIYNTNTKVPLIISMPGIYNKKVVEPVQLVDIFPTIINALGIKTKIPFDGKNLLKNVLGIDNGNEIISIDGHSLNNRALIYGDWKLFLSKQENGDYIPYELYDIKKDPTEQNNILFENMDIKDRIMTIYKNKVKPGDNL